MIKKRIVALLVCLALLLTGCGTGSGNNKDGEGAENNVATEQEITLLYCQNDTLNPFNTISKLNAELGLLMFEPLVKLDNKFEIITALADSVLLDGLVCTVTLKNAVFSDSSPVTADDIIYSYTKAKESDRFSSLFYEVQSVNALDAKSVVFTLNRHDPYFAKLLTFPIIKSGSDKLKNEDNVELAPIGAGRFVFDSEKKCLLQNDKFYGEKPTVTTIKLINAPDNESMEHYVEVGATDIYFADQGDENIIRMSGKRQAVNLNNLVYLGINHYYGPLKSDLLRYAISSAVDRTILSQNAFFTNALPATGFFHPSWEEVSNYQTLPLGADLKISVENLANIGYNELDKEGFRLNSNGSRLELSLLVNKDNVAKLTAANLIAEQLKSACIKINIEAVSEAEFHSRIRSGSFQLYIGEIKLQANMDISSLVLATGPASYGIAPPAANGVFDAETSYDAVVRGFYSGQYNMVDVATALLSSMPVIPLLYREAVVFYSDDITDFGDSAYSDIFLSIDKYKFK